MRLAKKMSAVWPERSPGCGGAITLLAEFRGFLVLLHIAGAAPAFAQEARADTLLDYPITALEGTLAERLTSSFEECRRNCSANASCVGFDHSPRSFDCRLFSEVDAARRHPYSAAGTRLPIDGYMEPAAKSTPPGKPSEGPAPETECDRLAAHPDDSDKIASVKGRWHWIPREAATTCEKAVAAYPNEPRFWFQLGRAYEKEQDVGRAEAFYQKSIDAGYTAGYVALGHLLRYFPRRMNERIALYQQAVDRGSRWGMSSLASEYRYLADGYYTKTHPSVNPFNERDKPDDPRGDGVSLLKRCAVLGSAECQWSLGMQYLPGGDAQRDPVRAAELFRQSSEGGYPMAMMSLGSLYVEGNGVERNYRLAAKNYIQAARTEPHFVDVILSNAPALYPAGVIREIQSELKAQGLYQGQIDGKLGPATRRALVAIHGADL